MQEGQARKKVIAQTEMYREYETERKLMTHRQYINQETIDSGLQIS